VIDLPRGGDLLRAMAEALTDDVIPNTTDQAQYSARIVANLCLIMAREVEVDPAESHLMLELLRDFLPEHSGDLFEMAQWLDSLIAVNALDDDQTLHRLLTRDVEYRLAIARPDYT
jgi:hypothetical protein